MSRNSKAGYLTLTAAQENVKAPKSCHITPILRSVHWLRITERIEYKLLSLTYKVLTTTQPSYLHNLISIQRPRSTRSSPVVTLARPPSPSSLKNNWSPLPLCFTLSLESAPFFSSSTSFWYQFFHFYSRTGIPSPITSSSSDSPRCTSIIPSLFHSQL